MSPPESRDERDEDPPASTAMPVSPRPDAPGTLRFTARRDASKGEPETRRAGTGARVSVEVSVPEPGDVTLEGLGLRTSADPRAPARFDLVVRRAGRYAVVFLPLQGRERIVARLVFAEEAATVRPREPAG